MEVDLPYLVEDRDRHGNVRIYFRRPGKPKIRLRAQPGTTDFMEEYRAAVSGIAKPAPHKRATKGPAGSLLWLCQEYYTSAEFKQLGRRTRYVRKLLLDGVCEKHGDKPARLMEARHVRKIRDAAAGADAEKPEAANGIVKALRQLFKWAIGAEHLKVNVANDAPYLSSNSDGFHTWSVEEVQQFEARHPIGTKPRLALALLLYIGVRRSDVVLLGRQMIRNGWLHFTETKGAERKPKHRELLVLPQLQEAIDATPSTNMTFLVTAFGKPFTHGGFGNWFRKRCDEAGLKGCSAHGLRKAGATMAADNGATEHQLMAIYGWDSPKQAALYTRKANRRKLSGDAMHLIAAGQTENKIVPLSPEVTEVGQKRGPK